MRPLNNQRCSLTLCRNYLEELKRLCNEDSILRHDNQSSKKLPK